MIGQIVAQGDRNVMSSPVQQMLFIVGWFEILAFIKQRIVANMLFLEHLTLVLIQEYGRIEQRLLSFNIISQGSAHQNRNVETFFGDFVQSLLAIVNEVVELQTVEGEITANG